jgi:transposase
MTKSTTKTEKKSKQSTMLVDVINPYAAGIDVGSRFHMVAVGQTEDSVVKFGVTTSDLHALCEHLKKHGVTSVALESTAYYWIPLFWMLQSYDLACIVINPSDIKSFNRPKTDVKDSRWLHKMHSLGLLKASFQLDNFSESLRTYGRRRRIIIKERTRQINRMYKVLTLMNVQIGTQLTHLDGASGTAVIEAIINGQTDPKVLLELIHKSVKTTREELLKGLEGTWQPQYIFELKQLWASYQLLGTQLLDCDEAIEQELTAFLTEQGIEPPDPETKPSKTERKIENTKNAPPLTVVRSIQTLTGIDMLAINGVGGICVLDIALELGFTLEQFPSAKHFTSWLGLAPNRKISGGKVLSSKTPKKQNHAATAFRQAANAIGNCKEHPLKPFFCGVLKRQGRKGAITATARKLAVIYYTMLKTKEPFDYKPQVDQQIYRERALKKIQKSINELNITANELKIAA